MTMFMETFLAVCDGAVPHVSAVVHHQMSVIDC